MALASQSVSWAGSSAAGGQPAVVATKFFPVPWRLGKGSLLRALRGSLKRLGMQQVDLYQIHFPLPPVSTETWMDGLADAVQAGMTRAVGVSNYNVEQTRRAHAALAKRGVPLASNQVEYSLLKRDPERTGLLTLCQELDVTLIAYSPLAKGLLTGKYTPENPPAGTRGRLFRGLSGAHPAANRSAAGNRCGPCGQESQPGRASNWVICKGRCRSQAPRTAPGPGERRALGWRLTADEIAALDVASDRVSAKSGVCGLDSCTRMHGFGRKDATRRRQTANQGFL